MPPLSEAQRNNAIGRLQACETQRHVVQVMGVTRVTISNLWRRYTNGNVRDRLRSGRPRITTPGQDRYIRVRQLRDRFITETSTATQWCRQGSRVTWPQASWRPADGPALVYRLRNECYAENCVQQVVPFGGGSVMVWGGIHHGGRTALVRVDGALSGLRYRDEILQRHVAPFINVNGGIYQQDNARPDVAPVSPSEQRAYATLACRLAKLVPY
ncbi:uncharacterized protein [Haliotis cracherodii]|uniref:uncharacterized protein n=1 Tax=Haliotis cracherodii TaxID=6455 RepID=UPI0039E9A671